MSEKIPASKNKPVAKNVLSVEIIQHQHEEIRAEQSFRRARTVLDAINPDDQEARKKAILHIAALPLSPKMLDSLGIRTEVDEIYRGAYSSLLKAGFTNEELSETPYSEMVALTLVNGD